MVLQNSSGARKLGKHNDFKSAAFGKLNESTLRQFYLTYSKSVFKN